VKVSELIADLQKMDQDLDVRIWADHGQMCMKATTVGVQRIRKEDENEHMIDDVIGDDEIDEDEQYYYFCEIGSP